MFLNKVKLPNPAKSRRLTFLDQILSPKKKRRLILPKIRFNILANNYSQMMKLIITSLKRWQTRKLPMSFLTCFTLMLMTNLAQFKTKKELFLTCSTKLRFLIALKINKITKNRALKSRWYLINARSRSQKRRVWVKHQCLRWLKSHQERRRRRKRLFNHKTFSKKWGRIHRLTKSFKSRWKRWNRLGKNRLRNPKKSKRNNRKGNR